MASLLASQEVQSADFWTTKRTTYGQGSGVWHVYCVNNWDATAYVFAYLAWITCERTATYDYPYESTTQSAAVGEFAASIEASNTIICPCGHTMTHRRTGRMWLHSGAPHAYDDEVVQWQQATPLCLL